MRAGWRQKNCRPSDGDSAKNAAAGCRPDSSSAKNAADKRSSGQRLLLLCALLALAIFVWSGVRTWRSFRPAACTVVEVVLDNQVICTIDLKNVPDQTIRVDSTGEIVRTDIADIADSGNRSTLEDAAARTDMAGTAISYNELRIENGTICVSAADCPDQTCVKMGILRSEELPIICLPHRLVIRFVE